MINIVVDFFVQSRKRFWIHSKFFSFFFKALCNGIYNLLLWFLRLRKRNLCLYYSWLLFVVILHRKAVYYFFPIFSIFWKCLASTGWTESRLPRARTII